MTHLSVRLAWHDNGWNGRVCSEPHLNAHCIRNEQIRKGRDDERERKNAESYVDDLEGWFPPCARDIGAYSDHGFVLNHSDPLEREFLKPESQKVPPYSSLPAPFRWMREENFPNICSKEDLSIRGPESDKDEGWVYEPDRQIKLLNHFWDQVEPSESLIFYYVNQGNPVDENASRIVVGVGRLKEIGDQIFFRGADKEGNKYPIWPRRVTQDYPNQGVRIPYQEYITEDKDPSDIACYIPSDSQLSFSYVGEHVTDDTAVGVLERIIQSVQKARLDGLVDHDWSERLSWLNDRLDDAWSGRGAYPGIGSLLRCLGVDSGIAFQRTVLGDLTEQGEDPLEYTIRVLKGEAKPPETFAGEFKRARQRWKAVEKIQGRRELFENLARIELTHEQMLRVWREGKRKSHGMDVTDKRLSENPYLAYELDEGGEESEPISLEAVDHGMITEPDRISHPSSESAFDSEAKERVRSIAIAVLENAAEQGDTVIPYEELLKQIESYFPERRSCEIDNLLVRSEQGYYEEKIWFDFDHSPRLAALRRLRNFESEVEEVIQDRARRGTGDQTEVDWQKVLVEEFGEPSSPRQKEALSEKEEALPTLASNGVSVLCGGAGTGKTKTVDVLLNGIEKVSDRLNSLLLAPTGKARVRLSEATGRDTYTIHQFLLKNGWFDTSTFTLNDDGAEKRGGSTVVIDECSMISLDLFATLFRCLKTDLIERIILVGDPNQLPPIGPGRPFVDTLNWLRDNHPECIAELQTSMRIPSEDEEGYGGSSTLLFADGYRTGAVNPGDDEMLSLVSQGESIGDLEVHYWDNRTELQETITRRLEDIFHIDGEKDYESFNSSLGAGAESEVRRADTWQILSPVRSQYFGVEDLNRFIQSRYKGGLLYQARQGYQNSYGDQEIVWTDKVIQIENQNFEAWPRDGDPLDYVANGEIGIVTSTEGSFLDVGFSTQPEYTYGYGGGQVDENLELAYALTVHKAQGSDFNVVFLVVPQEAATLSRELLYTGLTRFEDRLILLVEGDDQTLRDLRSPDESATEKRNTHLFQVLLGRGSEDQEAPYASQLIHRTKSGELMRSKSEVIVANVLDDLDLTWEYEGKLPNPSNPDDYRLPDFTIGHQGGIFYWEHLGLLNVPSYRESWRRKRRWYEETMGLPVVGPGGSDEGGVEPGTSPIVITSRDSEDGGIDQTNLQRLADKYIL